MAVDYLDSPLAIVAGLAIGSIVMAFWLLFEPYTRRHRGIALYIDIMFSIEAATIPLILIGQTPWKWPILDNLWYNFVMVRVSTNPTTAHAISYIFIMFSYFVYQRTFYSNWKSCLTIALLVFTHEGIWFLFYIPFKMTFSLWADINYMIVLTMVMLTYHIKYKLNWKYLAYFVAPIVLYNIVWLYVGFPVTVQSYTGRGTQLYPTELWSDFNTNAIEVFSWLYAIIISYFWAYAVRDTGPRPPKLKFTIKARW